MTRTSPTPSETDLTVREVATELQSSKKFVYNAIERGELPAIRYGTRFLRIERAALDGFKAAHQTTSDQERARLDPDTVAFLSELAAAAPALSEEQRDTIRAAFRSAAP